MNANRSAVRGLVFASVYAAAIASVQVAAGEVLPFHLVDLFLVGVGIAAYAFGWLPALVLFLLSCIISIFGFPGQESGLGLRSGADVLRLAIYTAANLIVIAGFHRLQRSLDFFRRTEESYRLLVDSASDGILVLDDSLYSVDANPRACEILQHSREELASKNLRDLVPAERRGWLEKAVADLKRGDILVRECEMLRAAGESFIGEVSARMLRDSRILLILRDVTERKRVEAALLRSEARFRRFFEATSEGIAIHDRGAILDANSALAALLGYSIDELGGRTIWEFAAPDDCEQVKRSALEGIEEPYEVELVRKDGSAVPVEIRGRMMPGAGGPLRVVAVRDVAERKALEDRLREAQKMEAIGRLAGGVAHDFNNLLTIITGYAHMLLEGVAPESPIHGCGEEILNASQRAAGLASQLLAFSRKQLMQPRPVDLNALVSGMQKLIRGVIGEHIQVDFEMATGLGDVRADPTQIEQVMMNLVLNARDAMPGGGRLLIRTSNAVISRHDPAARTGARPGPYALLEVSDNGIGMDAATRQRLFEPFFTTKEKGRGTGLGLATTYGIVKQHGGDIRVWSEPGAGTRFEIFLPQTMERRAHAATVTPEPLARGTETILLVEDEAAVRRMVREILEQHGYTVLEAADPPDSLRICVEHDGPIDLLLTDVIMPDMSGKEVAEAATGLRPGIKVLYISGYTDAVIAGAGFPEPGTNFLPKPFTPEVLARKVRQVLDR